LPSDHHAPSNAYAGNDSIVVKMGRKYHHEDIDLVDEYAKRSYRQAVKVFTSPSFECQEDREE
jgi:hypothetical protein